MRKEIRWGLLGCGRIAEVFVRASRHCPDSRIVAVGGRDPERTRTFAAAHGIDRHGDYARVLADPEVDAVYICMIHHEHAEWTLRALEAGKAVLCEKPAALDEESMRKVVAAAAARNLLFQEAFMYRFHPQTAALLALLAEKPVGEIRHVEASFGRYSPYNPDSRLFRPDWAGGVIYDVGVYPVSFASLIAGGAEPVTVAGCRVIRHGVDVHAAAVLGFESGLTAEIACSCDCDLAGNAVIRGTAGTIELPRPWVMSRGEPEPGLIILRRDGKEERREIASEYNSFSCEQLAFAEGWRRGQTRLELPAVTPPESCAVIRAVKRWHDC
ncbi:MAG: Gfo/Idh/MocA family protein [Victivallaceae bacterium]